MVDPVAEEPIPADAFRVNGVVELLPVDNSGTFLAMERSFSVGAGNTVGVYEISLAGATDVLGYEDLYDEATGTAVFPFTPVSKNLIFDVESDFGLVADNLEGMTFGPRLPDGRMLLILVSDNNFAANQFTQFLAVAIETAPAP